MEPISAGKSHARTSRPSAVQRKTRQPTTSIQYKRCSCTSHTGPSPMVVFTSTRTSIRMLSPGFRFWVYSEFRRFRDGDEYTVRILEAEPDHRETLVGLADHDLLGLAHDLYAFVDPDLLECRFSAFNKKRQTRNPHMIHCAVGAIANDRCRTCIFDQVDFSRLLGVCACREDVVRIDADFVLAKPQKLSIRFVGSRFES